MEDIRKLLSSLHIETINTSMYEIAFTHSSFNADAKTKHHDYERLEFLGDSVIGLVVSELAYEIHPESSQGELTKLKSALVNTKALAGYARKLNYPAFIRVGNSYSVDIYNHDSLLEDVFEASMGAIYLDKGFNFAKDFLSVLFLDDVKNFKLEDLKDYKSRLQEEMQAEHRESVTYELIKEEGPAHDKRFTVRVLFDGMPLGVGTASTKKAAEQAAAKAALEKKVS